MLESQKQIFSEARFNYLCDKAKEYGIKYRWYKELTVSEILYIINETPLSDLQRKGAVLYYTQGVKGKDIASRFGYSESDIKYHKKKISLLLRETCVKIFKKE